MRLGGEVWAPEPTGGHGVAMVHWRLRPSSGPEWDVVFNTDTLRAELGLPDLAEALRPRVALKFQYPAARLLTDHYRRGERISEREFNAGYGLVEVGTEVRLAPHFLDVSLRGRRWFFSRNDATASEFAMPPATWVGEARLGYTYWDVEPDRSQWEPHRPFARIDGWAGGASAQIDVRRDVRPWGAARRGGEESFPERNRPGRPVAALHQWAAVGAEIGESWRVQVEERARWGLGDDDLTRTRLGGMNPYVAPVAGLPWGALVSGRWVSTHAELRLDLPPEHEVGLFADGAAVADLRGSMPARGWVPVGGVGALADLRFGDWSGDFRVGTPLTTGWFRRRPALGVWLSVGRQF